MTAVYLFDCAIDYIELLIVPLEYLDSFNKITYQAVRACSCSRITALDLRFQLSYQAIMLEVVPAQ